MDMKKVLILIGIMFSSLMASGQEATKGRWDGGISLDAGTNFEKGKSTRGFSNSSGDVSAWGRYRTDKFMIRLNLQGLSKFTTTSTTGITANVKNPDDPQINFDINQNENKSFEETAGVQMEYKPDRQNIFSFNFRQKFTKQTPNKIVVSFQNIFHNDDGVNIDTKRHSDVEEGYQDVIDFGIDAAWNHRFEKAGREINSRMEWAFNRNDKNSIWHRHFLEGQISEEEFRNHSFNTGNEISSQTFRITPLNRNNRLNASVLYRDIDLFDQKSLNVELGTDLRIDYEKDNLSAANLIDKVWVDSLKYRENFDFVSIDLSPKARLSYSPGKFNFSLQLTPDLYVSKLDSDNNIGRFNFGRFYILPDMNASWTPNPNHKLGISYKQGISRPTYLQICWFQRSGADANEILMGNPRLKPGSNGKAGLYYTFQSGFFTGTLEGSATMNWDKIERVFNSDGDYRIYTWINSGHSVENSLKLTLKADLNNFDATINSYYNYFIGYNNAGDETRSSDWGVSGEASLRVKGGWIFNAKGRYQSKIIRTYSSITEYVSCDVRITKDFKKFSVYAEGKDLFEQPIMVSTYSEDKTNVRFEQHQYNRRLFSVGVSFRF